MYNILTFEKCVSLLKTQLFVNIFYHSLCLGDLKQFRYYLKKEKLEKFKKNLIHGKSFEYENVQH
jgi:hypothetical protein